MPRQMKQKAIIRDLGDGLVLRRATPEDAEALIAFNGRTLDGDDPGQFVSTWTRELMAGKHPTFKPRDFTVVEDTAKGEIVSSLNLFSQRWAYGGVEFGIGRPELVSTNPDYRRRGLIRAQFEVIHEWSRQRGHLLQAITGIPFFYRQFGYEMALELDAHRSLHKGSVPKLKEGEAERYRVRPAAEADLPFMIRTYNSAMSRSLVAAVFPRKLWRYLAFESGNAEQFRVIETPQGERVGFLVHRGGMPGGGGLPVLLLELKHGVSWLAVAPGVLRYLVQTGAELAARDKKDFEWIRLHLGTEHPLYQAIPDLLTSPGEPYAFYVRVPDLPAFLRRIAPVLEERLAKSVALGWSGELKLSFYREGLRLAFEKGGLAAAEAWSPAQRGESACFRGGTFLHLLFGMHSLQDLRALNPDCYPCGNDARVLLGVLFPKQASMVWPVC